MSRKEKIFESADGIARNKRGEDNEQTAPSEISRSASFSLIVSLCVPTICAHVRLPDTGHRHQRFSADRQKREEKREREREERKKNDDCSHERTRPTNVFIDISYCLPPRNGMRSLSSFAIVNRHLERAG